MQGSVEFWSSVNMGKGPQYPWLLHIFLTKELQSSEAHFELAAGNPGHGQK